MADSWFRKTHDFWSLNPTSVEGWGVIAVAFLFWIATGVGLDVINPTLFNIISFVLAGVFFYLIVVFVAYHTAEETRL